MTISTQRLRLLRGNSAAVAGFTGLQGEVVFNTDTYTLHLQDGVTSGGYSLATSAQVANITANANYGNSNVTSFLASNSNLAITTTANITTMANLLVRDSIATDSMALGIIGNADVQRPLLISNVGTAIRFLTGNRANGNTSIQLQANNSLSGIYIRNDNGSIGFNTIPSGPNIGYTFIFNGSLYANEFYTNANMPTGYQFNTTGDTGISHVEYGGNLSAIRIRHDSSETIKFYNNNTTEIRGNAVISDGSSYGTYPDAYMQIYGNISSYQQIVNQNLSNNVGASTDFVATADNGTDTTYYIDMGINSSQFNHAAWFPAANTANDGYLYVVGSNITGPSTGNIANLIIGSTNGVVKTFVGNTSDANVVTTVSTNLLTVSGNVNANYFIGNGSLLTGISGTGNYGNSNVAAFLAAFGSNSITTTGNITANYFLGNVQGLVGSITNLDSLNLTVENISALVANNGVNIGAGGFNNLLVLPEEVRIQNVPLYANSGNIKQSGASGLTIGSTHTVYIVGDQGDNNRTWTFDGTSGDLLLPNGAEIGDDGNDIGNTELRVPDGAGGQKIWTFDANGSLSTPGNVTVNDTLFIVGSIQSFGASPAPSLSGFSSISTVISGNPNEGNITAHNYLIANGGIITTGNISAGNLNATGANLTGNINASYFIGNGSQLTGLSSTAATVDITDTNGLTTTYYPTFVSNRAAGQVVRADVDLSYRTDTNTLNAGKITLTGTGTAVNASSGDILTNQVTGTQINFLSGIYTVSLNASGAAANYTLNLPANAGVNGQVLTTNGSGALSWSTPSSTYGNSNVVSLLSSFGSNVITTTGNIAAGNLNATGANLTGNITGGNLSISGNINGNTAGFALGYRDVPQVLFTSNATLALTDAGKHYYSVNSANIITIPNNTVVAFNIGTAIGIVQQGTANLTINPGSGVTLYMAGNISSGSRILSNVGMATLLKVDTNTWFINGTGLT